MHPAEEVERKRRETPSSWQLRSHGQRHPQLQQPASDNSMIFVSLCVEEDAVPRIDGMLVVRFGIAFSRDMASSRAY